MSNVNTKIADLVVSEKALREQVNIALPAINPLVASGIAASNSVYNEFLANGQRKGSLQFLNPLPTAKLSVISDDLSVKGEYDGASAGEYDAVKHYVAQAYGTAALTSMVTGRDTLADLRNGIARAWVEQYLAILVSTAKGAFAAATDLEVEAGAFSADAFFNALIDAQATKDERLAPLDSVLVTRAQRAVLKKANRNDFVPMSETNTGFDQVAGYNLIETNLVSGLGGIAAFSAGSIAFAEGSLPNDMEIHREALGGNLGGGEVLISRRQVMAMPKGFEWKGAARTGDNKAQLLTGLETASNWGKIDGVTASMIGMSLIKFTA